MSGNDKDGKKPKPQKKNMDSPKSKANQNNTGGRQFTGTTSSRSKGSCVELGDHVYEHGQRGSADQMQNSMKDIIKYVCTKLGTDMSNDL